MYKGAFVESGPTDDIFENPKRTTPRSSWMPFRFRIRQLPAGDATQSSASLTNFTKVTLRTPRLIYSYSHN